MKKMMFMVALFLLFACDALALEVAGVTIQPTIRTEQQDLKLNGYGIRKKFFLKIYLGALYTAQPVSSRS